MTFWSTNIIVRYIEKMYVNFQILALNQVNLHIYKPTIGSHRIYGVVTICVC